MNHSSLVFFFSLSRCSLLSQPAPVTRRSHHHQPLLSVVLLLTSSRITFPLTLTTPTTSSSSKKTTPPFHYHHLLLNNTHCYRLLQHAISNGTCTNTLFTFSHHFCCSSPQTVCCALREQLQAPVATAKSSSGVVHIALVVCALCTCNITITN